MTANSPQFPPPPAPPLEAWLALSADDRVAYIVRAEDPDGTLLAFGDASEALAQKSVAAAIAAAETLVEAAESAQRSAPRSRLLRALVTALAYAGRSSDALRAAEASVSAARAAQQPVDACRAQVASLHPLTALGRIADALATGELARTELLALGMPKLAARADINLGNIQKAAGDPNAARLHLERARTALADEPVMVAHLQNALGEVHLLRDDLRASRSAFESSLAHFQASDDRFAVAMLQGNLADLAAREGRLQESLSHFETARRALERDVASAHLARIAAEEAEVLEVLGVPGEAEAALSASIAWLEPHGFPIEAARARLARASALARLGRIGEAQRDVASVTATAREREQRRLLLRAELLGAELALAKNEFQAARDLARAVRSDPIGTQIDRMIAWHHLARACAALDEPDEALLDADEMIRECRAMDLAPLLSDLLLARAQLRQGHPDAVLDQEEAVAAIERYRATLRAERLRAAWLGSRTRAYEALALTRLSEGTPAALDAAFDAVERSKSRALLDLVQRAVDQSSAPSNDADDDDRRLAQELESLRRRLSALYARWDGERSNGERFAPSSTLGASLSRAMHDEELALNRVTNRLAAIRGERSILAIPPSAAEVRRRLPASTALVEYFFAHDELIALVVRADGMRAHRHLGHRTTIDDLTTRILFQMRRATRLGAAGYTRGINVAVEPLQRMFAQIVAPLLASIGDAADLVIVPHGPLHGVPFHALHDGTRYAIERWNMRTAPSAAIALAKGTHRAHPAEDTVIVGVPDASAPFIDDEVLAIARLRPDARILRGNEATAEAFLRTAGNCRVLHLACHGRFADGLPQASGLRLADRWVSVRELLALRLAADVVILAGCETGRSAIEPGDEAVGLARSCIAAGAAAVIVSQWPVHDAAAGAFMTELHRQLVLARSMERGCDDADDRTQLTFPALASVLRATMLATMRARPHPAFWAAFTLIGAESDIDSAVRTSRLPALTESAS